MGNKRRSVGFISVGTTTIEPHTSETEKDNGSKLDIHFAMNFSQHDFNETSMRALARKNSIFKTTQLTANHTASDL